MSPSCPQLRYAYRLFAGAAFVCVLLGSAIYAHAVIVNNYECEALRYCRDGYDCTPFITPCGNQLYPFRRTIRRQQIGECIPRKGSQCTFHSQVLCAEERAYKRQDIAGNCLEGCFVTNKFSLSGCTR